MNLMSVLYFFSNLRSIKIFLSHPRSPQVYKNTDPFQNKEEEQRWRHPDKRYCLKIPNLIISRCLSLSVFILKYGWISCGNLRSHIQCALFVETRHSITTILSASFKPEIAASDRVCKEKKYAVSFFFSDHGTDKKKRARCYPFFGKMTHKVTPELYIMGKAEIR